MTYYTGLELLEIRDHIEEVLREVRKLRLEKRLREDRKPRPRWRFALAFRKMPPLPRGHLNALEIWIL